MATFLTVPLAEAQLAKMPRIGLLSTQSASRIADRVTAFRQGLADHGYVEQKNILVEYRWADGKNDHLPKLAEDLARLNVDLLVTFGGTPAILAAKNATSTIPIVFCALGTDPVELGLVKSFARPGGNITGVGSGGPELYGKRLELLKEAVPTLSRVAYLRNPENPAARLTQEQIRISARALGLQIQTIDVRHVNELDSTFQAAIRGKANGLILAATPPLNSEVKNIVSLALKNRLPAVYTDENFPDSGGLMSYNANQLDVYRRAASHVDKILKGTKTAELPVEQPKKFDLVINLKTAKQIGLTIPPNVLARADRVLK